MTESPTITALLAEPVGEGTGVEFRLPPEADGTPPSSEALERGLTEAGFEASADLVALLSRLFARAGEPGEHRVLVTAAESVPDGLHAGGHLVALARLTNTAIECTGDAHLLEGASDKGAHRARMGGNLHAKKLDGVHAEVGRDAVIEREALNCDLLILGGLRARSASIVGGRLIITGHAEVGALGSAAGVPTCLVLGSVPALEPMLAELEALSERLAPRAEIAQRELDQLQSGGLRLAASDKERSTELTFELHRLNEKLARCTLMKHACRERIARLSTVRLTVHGAFRPGAIISVGKQEFHVKTPLEGPLTIERESPDRLLIRLGEAPPEPLTRFADLRAASAD